MLGQSLIFPADQLRVALMIVATIPVSLLLYKLPTTLTRKYFSLILGAYLQYYVYGNEVLLAFAMHLLIYSIMVIKGRRCGFLVTFTSLVLLSVYHMYRMLVDYGGWKLDVSTVIMGNVCKYSLFAYSYEDGDKPDQLLKTADQRKQKILQLPNFIDFLAYCLFLPTCVIGTPIIYNRYLLYMNKQQQFSNVPQGPCLIKLGKEATMTAIFLILHIFGHLYFPNSVMAEPDYPNRGFWFLYFYGFFSVFFTTFFKYIVAFYLSMLPIHSSGISYEPISHGDQFQGVQIIDFWILITSINPQTKINNWNLPVQQWLRKCIYQRVNTSKKAAKIITFLCSSFWHGLYGGYYITFAFFFLELQLATAAYKFSKNQTHPFVRIYRIFEPVAHFLIWIYITILFYHNALYFAILCSRQGIAILKSLYFTPLILLVIPIAVFTLWKEDRPEKQFIKDV